MERGQEIGVRGRRSMAFEVRVGDRGVEDGFGQRFGHEAPQAKVHLEERAPRSDGRPGVAFFGPIALDARVGALALPASSFERTARVVEVGRCDQDVEVRGRPSLRRVIEAIRNVAAFDRQPFQAGVGERDAHRGAGGFEQQPMCCCRGFGLEPGFRNGIVRRVACVRSNAPRFARVLGIEVVLP